MKDLLSGVSDAYPYEIIQYHDSWLAVDPVIGCKASCSYCLLRIPGWTGVRPQVVDPVEDVVERLMSHRYFDAHETRLCFGTRTDVLLPEVRPHALRFLRALDAKGLRNAVALITKLEVLTTSVSGSRTSSTSGSSSWPAGRPCHREWRRGCDPALRS